MNLEDVLKKNKPLCNTHAGKRCFIIGNGPSLNSQDITLLKDEITITVSSFFRHPDAQTVNPDYWVLADPNFWLQPEMFFLPLIKVALDKAIATKLFIPTGGFSYFSGVNFGPLIDLHFFHYDQSKDIRSAIDFMTGVPPFGQNVVIVALMLAFYLGCNPIYFIGCDHDFMKTRKEDYESMAVQHFYAIPSQTKNKASEHLTWDQWQSAMARMNYEYDQLKQYASFRHFNVYNATEGGYFDNFPRIDFESLFTPSRNPLNIGTTTEDRNQRDAHHLGAAAIRLMSAGDHESADALLDVAIKCSINAPRRVEGLYYLKALCLAKLGNCSEALLFARSDYASNPSNREKSEQLVRQLESMFGVQTGGIPHL
jgi:hypothetical protein